MEEKKSADQSPHSDKNLRISEPKWEKKERSFLIFLRTSPYAA